MLRRRAQSKELLRARKMPLRSYWAIVMAVVGVNCAAGAPGPPSTAPMPFPPPQLLAVQPVQPMPAQMPRQMPYQQPPAAQVATAPAMLPEPIYWKQHLFLIPSQWGSAAEPGAARAVWLFVSKDRGASWQKISEAKPDVKAFNYRAEGDGEYWFAVRTFDKQGRAWPQGPY